MFGHWPYGLDLNNKFKKRLEVFLKRIFTDQLEHKHFDEVLAKMEPLRLLVCCYKVDNEDVDILSCLIYEYLDSDEPNSPTGIVYIATSPIFHGLSLGSLMLCILSQLLLRQHCCNTLFIPTAPNNQSWYESHQLIEVNSENNSMMK